MTQIFVEFGQLWLYSLVLLDVAKPDDVNLFSRVYNHSSDQKEGKSLS